MPRLSDILASFHQNDTAVAREPGIEERSGDCRRGIVATLPLGVVAWIGERADGAARAGDRVSGAWLGRTPDVEWADPGNPGYKHHR